MSGSISLLGKCDRLSAQGYQVLPSNAHSSTPFIRKTVFFSTKNFLFLILTLHGSVADPDPAYHIDEDLGTDPIFHLAAVPVTGSGY